MPKSLDGDLLLLRDISRIPFSVDPIRPNCHLSCDQLYKLPHFDLIIECLCCHFGEWMKAEVRLCSLVHCTLHTLSNTYHGAIIQLLFKLCEYNVYWILVYSPPLCMIHCLTVAIMQYTIYNRLFYQLSKISLLCEPFACGTCPFAAIWLPRATNFSFVFSLVSPAGFVGSESN